MYILKIITKLSLCVVFVSIAFPFFVFSEDLAVTCQNLTESAEGCPGLSSDDCKVLLQKCSDYYDQQSTKISQDISKTSQQKNTLSNQIDTLQKRIKNLDYQINQSSVKVKTLNVQIEDTKSSIDDTSEKIGDTQNQIKNVLRAIYEEDKKSSIEILLEGNLSEFFNNLVNLENLNLKINNLLDSTKKLNLHLQDQKVKMDGEVDQLQKTIVLQSTQKNENEANKKTQETYLNLTEAQYQAQLADRNVIEAKKAKIQAMLFSLAGTDDTEAPSFGEAIDIAKSVGSLVGIRPAFLLAVISQESAIGRNVGQCVLTDNTGNGKKISTGTALAYPRAMHPTRDIPPFLQITESLGKDPYSTPISCWIYDVRKGSPYGWGGAMGPAQFIPSTWKLYDAKIQNLLSKTPNPWGIKDAFTASGLYLADLGAKKQTTTSESSAASRYYGGSSAYASSVLNRASCIQTFIDAGTMSAYCQNLIF
jgi:peptidoglycan hydrolase CwlO-like protein